MAPRALDLLRASSHYAGKKKGEGSVLGGLGDMVMGDNW